MNVDNRELTQLSSPPEFNGLGSPVWSSDGKKIGFDAWRASAGESFLKAHVFVAKADGSEPQDLGDGAMPSFSRDGKQIAFSRYAPNQGVWTMTADGSEKKLLDRDGWGARWSPDGRYIAYTIFRDGANIVVYDVQKETRHRVLDAAQSQHYQQIFWSFCFSPDSKQVCFKAARRDGESAYEVAVANVDGKAENFKVLLKRTTGNKFSWHPDGKQILFSIREPMSRSEQLYVVPADKGEPESLRGQPFDRVNTGPDWSPDGKRIIFASRQIKKQ